MSAPTSVARAVAMSARGSSGSGRRSSQTRPIGWRTSGSTSEIARIVPAVNQIEQHPYFSQSDVQAFDAEHGILTQAWSPIGGITFYRDGNHHSTLADPVIVDIARAHGKSAAQVMLRWGLQHGRSVIPKSTKPERIAENIDVFDFELSTDDMAAIDGLDTGRRGGPEPEAITLESFGRDIPEA